MAQILVRDLDSTTVEQLKARAARNRRSLQAEVRDILEDAAERTRRTRDVVTQAKAFQDEFRGRVFEDSAVGIREDRDSR